MKKLLSCLPNAPQSTKQPKTTKNKTPNRPNRPGDASGLLRDILTAISGTISASGCSSAAEFTTGVYSRLVDQDPGNKAELLKAFTRAPAIAKCGYKFG